MSERQYRIKMTNDRFVVVEARNFAHAALVASSVDRPRIKSKDIGTIANGRHLVQLTWDSKCHCCGGRKRTGEQVEVYLVRPSDLGEMNATVR